MARLKQKSISVLCCLCAHVPNAINIQRLLVKTNLTMTEEVLTPSQTVEIVIFYCSPTDSNTFIRRMRENAIMEGRVFFYELLMALYFYLFVII